MWLQQWQGHYIQLLHAITFVQRNIRVPKLHGTLILLLSSPYSLSYNHIITNTCSPAPHTLYSSVTCSIYVVRTLSAHHHKHLHLTHLIPLLSAPYSLPYKHTITNPCTSPSLSHTLTYTPHSLSLSLSLTLQCTWIMKILISHT